METATMKIVRKHIVFHGYVQGVGFRWRALNAANSIGCTGKCTNEWDGTVEMEIQGTKEMIDKVIEMIERGRYVEITRMDVTDMPVDERERSFWVG